MQDINDIINDTKKTEDDDFILMDVSEDEEENELIEDETVAEFESVVTKTARQVRKNKDEEPKKVSKFWIGLGIYSAILIVLAIIFLVYTDKCLKRYEAAQPEHAVEEYVKVFELKASNNTITDTMVLPSDLSEFEDVDTYKQLYMQQLQNVSAYSFKKNPGSYITESPVYDIYADDKKVAKLTLNAVNTETIFAILTVMDWQVAKLEPVCDVAKKSYTIKVPDIYTVKVNGVALSDKYLTENVTKNQDYEYASEYVDMPDIVEYKISGLITEPDIKIYSGETEIAYEKDDNGNIAINAVVSNSTIPQDKYDMALLMAQTWSNFTTADLSGPSHGLATIRKYLIKDSYYWNMATEYATGVDITFISAHTLQPDPFMDIVIDNYVSYGENCFSCRIFFNKPMYLYKTGATVVENVDSTFYFVYYDDSDDGVDNPHWGIVDMIATTK
ncbi:MAG: hypothetical protein IKL73_05925 [Lachnospiraceae bacterium]|nr:hypothetical protein [Lachnospiraceae bacterium]